MLGGAPHGCERVAIVACSLLSHSLCRNGLVLGYRTALIVAATWLTVG